MKKQHVLDVITLAVNVIIIWLLDSAKVIQDKEKFLVVITLAVNVIIIWFILDSKGTTIFGCNRTSCKRYYNLDVRL